MANDKIIIVGRGENKMTEAHYRETPKANPLFRHDATYMDKVYRNMIIEMNQFIKQQRHLSQ